MSAVDIDAAVRLAQRLVVYYGVARPSDYQPSQVERLTRAVLALHEENERRRAVMDAVLADKLVANIETLTAERIAAWVGEKADEVARRSPDGEKAITYIPTTMRAVAERIRSGAWKEPSR